MTRLITHKVWTVLAGLAVAGASVFTAAPTGGCEGDLEVLLKEAIEEAEDDMIVDCWGGDDCECYGICENDPY